MAKKKVVIIIVEGFSDERALSSITEYVKTIFNLHIYFSNGDIFTKTTSKKAKAVVGDEIQKVMNETRFSKNDILGVIQITDTDGTFINDKSIIIDNSIDNNKILYFDDSIKVSTHKSSLNIIKRNKEKAISLRTMCSASKIKDFPYYLLYFSCNLDHIIENERNLSEFYKTSKAKEFANRFKGNPTDFIQFFNDNSFMVNGTMKETWEFIQLGNNSLKRYSNFHIIFDILDALSLEIND